MMDFAARNERPACNVLLTIIEVADLTRRHQKPKPLAREDGRLPDAGESRGAVALTIAWMLTCMSTAVAMIVVLISRLLLAAVPGEGREASALATISGVILLVAVATGFLCLILTPLVYRARISPPPRPITIFAILIGLAPLVALAVLAL